MTGTALGWRTHSGWAVVVAVSGTPSHPHVLARERVQLVDEPLPRMAYHAIEAWDLSLKEGKALVAKVRRTATTAATKAMKAAVQQHGADAIGVVGKVRNVPDDVHRALRTRAASAGLSLSDFALGELERAAHRPPVAELLQRARSRAGGASHRAIVAAVRSGRDRA